MYAMTTSKHIGYGLAMGLVASSCGTTYRTLHEDHCANHDGDAWCRDKYADGSRSYCSRGISGCEAAIELNSSDLDGCVASQPVDDACYSPCGGHMDVAGDASCLSGTSSTGDSGSETSTIGSEGSSDSGSGSSTTGPMPCTMDEECTEPEAPFCEPLSGECVACDGMADPDGACAGADPLLPLCVGGTCVACTPENPLVCDEQLLLCDGSTNACVPCTEHGQCGSGACELAVGTCFPDDLVVHVDGDGGQDFMDVTDAVAAVAAGGYGVLVVHEQDSGLGYPGVLIDGGKRIALLGAPGESPILQGTGGNPGLRVDGAGTVLYVEGLEVSLAAMNAVGLRVNGALAWVDRSRIVQNSGGGVLAEAGAELTLRNCFVGSLGDVIGVEVVDASASILYSTVTASTFGTTSALGCSTPTAIDVRNSIVVNQGGGPGSELACPEGSPVTSATESTVGDFSIGWFVDFNGGDYALSASGSMTFADVAQWTTGDPLTDIDGDPRPAIDGSPDYAGADVP